MAAKYLETTRNKLRYLLGTSGVNDVDEGFEALAEDVSNKTTPYAEGTFAGRPAAGMSGRVYRCTDTKQVFVDNGIAWEELARMGAISAELGWETGDFKWSGRTSCGELWYGPCYGQAISRATYAKLFAALGTRYGVGDGATTFNVPDGRDRTLVGASVSRALGSSGGQASVVLSVGNLPPHGHGISDPGHSHGVNDPGHAHNLYDPGHAHGVAPMYVLNLGGSGPAVSAAAGAGFPMNYATPWTGASGVGLGIYAAATGIWLSSAGTGISTTDAGSGTAHENLPPYQTANLFVHL